MQQCLYNKMDKSFIFNIFFILIQHVPTLFFILSMNDFFILF